MRLFSSLLFACVAFAQDQASIQRHIERAKAIAGTTWSEAATYFCAESSMPNRPTDPAIAPTRLFDNLSVIGSVGTAVYVVHTSEGLILIDGGYPEQIDTVLLPGLKALGLDPRDVRYMLIAHGHSDHFGAAKRFQDAYGTKIYLSSEDWDLLSAPAAKGKGDPVPLPKRDQIIRGGQTIVLGDTRIQTVAVPGHTPGAVAFLFPVFDKGKKYEAGLFGGTVLSAGFVSADGLRDYIKSIGKYRQEAAANHVEVEIQNHPLMDGFAKKLDALAHRAPQATHPFVVGEKAYLDFLDVISECSEAQLERKTK